MEAEFSPRESFNSNHSGMFVLGLGPHHQSLATADTVEGTEPCLLLGVGPQAPCCFYSPFTSSLPSYVTHSLSCGGSPLIVAFSHLFAVFEGSKTEPAK